MHLNNHPNAFTMSSNRLKTEKRKRLTQACDPCHQKKIRCDGQKPTCGSCARANNACIYPSTVLKRGPRQGFTERLECRLEAMERKMVAVLDLLNANFTSPQKLDPQPKRAAPTSNPSSVSPYPLDASTPKPSSGLGPFPFLTQELSLNLLKLYFELVHPALPILHPATFFQRYNNNEIPPLLLFSMFSVVSKFSDLPEIRATPRWKQGEMFEAYAVTQLVGVSDFSLDYLAALLLLGKSLYQRGKAARGWLYGGMAVRVAHFLDLHKVDQVDAEGKPQAPESWILAERQRRTWWGCYTIDGYASAATGRPPAAQESSILVSLPKVAEGWEDDPTHTIPPGITPTAGQPWFTQYIKLVTILSKVGRFVNTPIIHHPAPTLLNQRIASYHAQLSAWVLQLPDDLKIENAPLTSPPTQKISPTTSGAPTPSTTRSGCPHRAAQLCLRSADTITSILSEVFKVFPLLYSPFYVNYCSFLASTVYLDSLLHLPWDELVGTSNKFAANYQLIQSNLVNWSMSEQYCRILKDIYYAKSSGSFSQAPAEAISSLVTLGGSAPHPLKFDEAAVMPLFKSLGPLAQNSLGFPGQGATRRRSCIPLMPGTSNGMFPELLDLSRFGAALASEQLPYQLLAPGQQTQPPNSEGAPDRQAYFFYPYDGLYSPLRARLPSPHSLSTIPPQPFALLASFTPFGVSAKHLGSWASGLAARGSAPNGPNFPFTPNKLAFKALRHRGLNCPHRRTPRVTPARVSFIIWSRRPGGEGARLLPRDLTATSKVCNGGLAGSAIVSLLSRCWVGGSLRWLYAGQCNRIKGAGYGLTWQPAYQEVNIYGASVGVSIE
ncbi:hypothetical protein L0F63_006315 [Massospora cicadina]|nr:hypothetical protein L0F63_006315 [Massospora cicadina]